MFIPVTSLIWKMCRLQRAPGKPISIIIIKHLFTRNSLWSERTQMRGSLLSAHSSETGNRPPLCPRDPINGPDCRPKLPVRVILCPKMVYSGRIMSQEKWPLVPGGLQSPDVNEHAKRLTINQLIAVTA